MEHAFIEYNLWGERQFYRAFEGWTIEMNHVEKNNYALSRGFTEVFGSDTLPAEEITTNRILAYIMNHHSENEGEGLANEVGKFAYHPLKLIFEDELGFRELSFRTLASDERAAAAVSRILERTLLPAEYPLTSELLDSEIRLSVTKELLSDRLAALALRLTVGILQEAYADMSGGKALHFQIENRRTLRLFK